MMADVVRCKVVIDCDPGTDDAIAILMALADDALDVVAITTVFGNASLEDTSRNALRLLTFSNNLNIPVYKGCETSFLFEPSRGNGYHGDDGFGDVIIEGVDPVDLSLLQAEHAANFLCRLVAEQPGCITLVAIGPLTNIATALMLDTDFGSKLKDCIVMGGNYLSRGNVTPAAEFNFWSDPEAACCVLAGLGRPLTLLPFETCELFSFSYEWYAAFTSRPNKTSALIKNIEVKTLQRIMNRRDPKYWTWDQLAVAVAINPCVVLESKDVYATVELHGTATRGQMVVDWNSKLGKVPNVRLVLKMDGKLYEKMVLKVVE